MEKTVCELFAGVGGFRLGLEASSKDWKTVWFSQWEPGKTKQWAHDCYVKHFGAIDGQTGMDIAKVDKQRIPDHNLLVGGFPCQDYSVARTLANEKGITGKKGVLWWSIRDTIIAKKPAFCLFENVDRLLKSPSTQRGRDFGVILACLDSLGYSVEWRVINAAEYGAAQRRRRIFIFASRNDTHYAKSLYANQAAILSQSGFFARCFPLNTKDIGATFSTSLDSSDIYAVSQQFAFEFENSGFLHNSTIHTVKAIPQSGIEPQTLRSLLDTNVDTKYFLGENIEKWHYLKGSKRFKRVSKDGHPYIYSEGAIAFPDPIDAPARTMLTSESSLNRSTHVIEDPETGKLRLITPNEAEAIQGFPKGWTNTGMPEKTRYFCMGNALVVPMVTRMGGELNRIFAAEGDAVENQLPKEVVRASA